MLGAGTKEVPYADAAGAVAKRSATAAATEKRATAQGLLHVAVPAAAVLPAHAAGVLVVVAFLFVPFPIIFFSFSSSWGPLRLRVTETLAGPLEERIVRTTYRGHVFFRGGRLHVGVRSSRRRRTK